MLYFASQEARAWVTSIHQWWNPSSEKAETGQGTREKGKKAEGTGNGEQQAIKGDTGTSRSDFQREMTEIMRGMIAVMKEAWEKREVVMWEERRMEMEAWVTVWEKREAVRQEERKLEREERRLEREAWVAAWEKRME